MSSGVTALAPSEYSQEGTTSEGGGPPFRMVYAHGGADDWLYTHLECQEPEGSMSHACLGGTVGNLTMVVKVKAFVSIDVSA